MLTQFYSVHATAISSIYCQIIAERGSSVHYCLEFHVFCTTEWQAHHKNWLVGDIVLIILIGGGKRGEVKSRKERCRGRRENGAVSQGIVALGNQRHREA
jgi:hypothetical protein